MSAVLKEVAMAETHEAAVTGAPEGSGLPIVPPGAWADGVDALVHLLRYPEKVHRWPLCDLPVNNKEVVDWGALAQQLTAVFEEKEMRCIDAYLILRLALAVLKMKEVPLCAGPVGVCFWLDECGFQNVHLELSVDTDSYRALKLSEDLWRLKSACHAGRAGFSVSYESVHPYDPAHWPPRPAWEEGDDEDGDDEE